MVNRGVFTAVGRQIGVGKESGNYYGIFFLYKIYWFSYVVFILNSWYAYDIYILFLNFWKTSLRLLLKMVQFLQWSCTDLVECRLEQSSLSVIIWSIEVATTGFTCHVLLLSRNLHLWRFLNCQCSISIYYFLQFLDWHDYPCFDLNLWPCRLCKNMASLFQMP